MRRGRALPPGLSLKSSIGQNLNPTLTNPR